AQRRRTVTKFPNAMPILLECARKETQGLWAIGDALVDETDGSQRALRKVRAALDERGLGQDPKFPTLRKLFDTSVAFPPDRRRDVSWKLHAEAGNPDFLDDILRENKRNPDTFCK